MTNDGQLGTFERSCRHWSEDGRAEMEAFYQLATVDYQLLAEQLNWGQVFQTLENNCGEHVRLLDVACGSGQFPAALAKHGRLQTVSSSKISYSLLDPSKFSIDTARSRLKTPFVPSEEFECTIQQFQVPDVKYAMAWATHALYCVPLAELGVAMGQMLRAVDEAGVGFIAHACQESHYVQFHDLYLQGFRTGHAEPYSTGEQILEILKDKVSPQNLAYWSIRYEGKLDLNERETAEKYLQRCLFDDSVKLDDMLEDEHMGSYLRNCIDEEQGFWRFPQQVLMILFGRDAHSIAEMR